jgi:hypothetical protein
VIVVDLLGNSISQNIVENLLEDLKYKIEEFSCDKVIFDLRNTFIANKFSNVYRYGLLYASSGVNNGIKTASVYSNKSLKYKVIEKVLLDRGFIHKSFDKIAEAFLWISQ